MKYQFAEQYSDLEQWHWWFRGRQRILDAVLRREPSARGRGLGHLPLAQPHGCVVGLDAEVLHARHVALDVSYVIGTLENVPLAAASFDLVLALDVLEHLDDDARGLREAARLLKPGGLLVVTVPALPSLWGGQDVVSHHRRRYLKRTLGQTFARAGLPAPRLTYFNVLLFAPVACTRWLRRALGQAQQPRSDFDDNQPGLLNEILASVFAAERYLIHRLPMPVGVSLLAILHLGQDSLGEAGS